MRLSFRLAIVACGLSLVAASGYTWWRFRIPSFPYNAPEILPVVHIRPDSTTVSMPNGILVAEVGDYMDELAAYLHFEYLQGLQSNAGTEVLMATREEETQPHYRLYLLLDNDLLSATERLAALQNQHFIGSFHLLSPPVTEIEDWEKQTRIFDAAYHRPVRKRLLQLPQRALTSAVAEFILFKVRTDRRVREQIEPAADKALSAEDAQDFAADMIDVAKFYGLPLDMLLGIGAMENNYLDIRGDLKHAVWKRHAQPGDIVLRRRGRRVLVSNYSLGPWQITRETLRYAHSLWLHDHRDYQLLPPRLRPPRKLDFSHITTGVLTTYAGLLLRNLLDYFHGDVAKAEGAYNGGRASPNMNYSEGVSMVATYARRVVSMAAGRKGNKVAETKLTVADRGE
jgi:hypothetical protein